MKTSGKDYSVEKTDEQWREELTPEQYRVLREAGTERAWTGELLDESRSGLYTCAACNAAKTENQRRWYEANKEKAKESYRRWREARILTEKYKESNRAWKKANPGYGRSLQPDYIARAARRARNSPASLNTFLRLHLNVRTGQVTRWVGLDKWDRSDDRWGALPELEQLRGRTGYAGLDLASSTDLAALAMFECPRDSLRRTPRLLRADRRLRQRARRRPRRLCAAGPGRAAGVRREARVQ